VLNSFACRRLRPFPAPFSLFLLPLLIQAFWWGGQGFFVGVFSWFFRLVFGVFFVRFFVFLGVGFGLVLRLVGFGANFWLLLAYFQRF
jgi:hypothetical protein